VDIIDPLLTDKEVAQLLGGVSRPTVWRHAADGTIPKPVKIGGLSRWPRSEILAVVERAKAARDRAAA
jgi:excisionase family DNA binding protein